ncbi:unnamed protein product [Camellia sinensis]
MKDLGPAQQMLGMQIARDRKAKKLWLSQEKYAERVIAKFNMKDSKPLNTPLANHFKLSKSFCPSSTKKREEMEAIPYSSAVGSLIRGAVSWQSKLQKCVALSTTEAEYIAAAEARKEMLWLQRFLQELGLKQEKFTVHCDSQSAIDLSEEEEEEEMSDYLPEEVWIRNILTTLSIKTLLRCRSVCKSWYSRITSPSFISAHLNRNKQEDPPLLLLRHCSERPRKEHFSIHHDNPTLDDYAELDFPFHSVNWYFRIVGSCNGVVCLSNDHVCYVRTIILWNPSIRKSFNLPRPNVVFQTHGPFMHSIGFGFDLTNHECKVVRVTYVEDDDGHHTVPPEVELYSLSRGCWQSISDCGVQSIIPEQSPQLGYDMWVMEKYGLVESWTKLFAIIDYQESLGPVIGFRKNNEVLLVSSGNLVSYDPETKEKKNHGIHGIGYLFYVDTYVESLVLVRGGEQIVLGYIQNSDGDSDNDSVFSHLANGYANPVEIGVSSIDLSDDEDTKSNKEDDDERMREVTDSAIRRAFREDESCRNAPLTAETATRMMEGWGPRILYWTKAPNSED